MVIDVHGHIGQKTPGTTPPARVATYAGVCGVDHVLVSNRDGATQPAGAANLDETEANLACLEACRSCAHLLPLYWTRPGQIDSSVHAFAGALDTEPFVGAVFSPVAGGFDAADEMLRPYLGVLATAGRPALFCLGGDERAAPAKIYQQARRYPHLRVVLCNCGTSESDRAAALDVARQALRRQDANVYLDTSQTSASEIRSIIQTIGVERVLFGTNAVSYGDSHVPRHIALLDELRRSLAPAAFAQLTRGNAERLFGIEPPDPGAKAHG